MKILIIEDEERSFKRLRRLLLQIDETFEIEGPVTSVGETTEILRKANELSDAPNDKHNKFDLIFADIRLDDGDVFDGFVQTMPTVPVIFTTAYNEYALEAFRSNGIAYILKPIVTQELEEAVEKAKHLIKGQQAEMSTDYVFLLKSLGLQPQQQSHREHFLVQNNDGYTVLNVQDINHISTENGITRAYLYNGRSMVLNYSLNDIEAQLNPSKFFRANRQYIIGIDSIQRINFLFSSKLSVCLKDYPDVEIIVSKKKSGQLKEWIDR